MKKAKQVHTKREPLSAAQVVEFLEDFRAMAHGRDDKTEMISLRVPKNILAVFKAKAKGEGRKYQTVIVEQMRKWAQAKPGKLCVYCANKD
jgi:predicted DNA binding CopG/RHH family protein